MVKGLEQRPRNLEVPNLSPPGARSFFYSSSFNGRVSLIRSLKRDVSLLLFLFSNNTLSCVA